MMPRALTRIQTRSLRPSNTIGSVEDGTVMSGDQVSWQRICGRERDGGVGNQ
jgi:hypothetical protein